MSDFLKKECDLKYFHDNGYIRKKCEKCKDYFWTLDENMELCGDQPCVPFNFINNPGGKKPLNLSEVRESFLNYFEQNNHSRLNYPETGERCPVIARWRSDIYLTIASIADFQPHVTSGEVPPPANPLVISQPCIRLNDLESVGVSGRHLTMFEMMGHHSFNKKTDEIYFKEDTVRYCDEYFTKHIGIERNKITYKEQLWFGGGNAGPCLEVLAGGLEIATLVFMNMREDPNGDFEIEGKKYTKNPLNIVDTGYGLERIAWYTNGTKTVYETVFPKVIDFIKQKTGNKDDLKSIYSLADHSKCLSFMLGDGIVPSNVKSGYLARLIIRRSLRFIEKLKLDISLKEIVDLQLELLEKDFPSLKKRKKQIDEILDIETDRYIETLSKGKSLVKRILSEKNNITTDELIKLYDTHGMPPAIVKNIAKKQGKEVKIPENFDSMVAELHSHEETQKQEKKEEKKLPETKKIYYDDHYKKEFEAEVIYKEKQDGKIKIILDQTCFYPEGGGQPSDTGFLYNNGNKIVVSFVEKKQDTILHHIDRELEIGTKVKGEINWDFRYQLMKHHTGTHVVNGALRKVLGEHVWQAGSNLTYSDARFDFTHYKNITDEERKLIEKIANDSIKKGQIVEKNVFDRNTAEKKYGFRLYQGGVPPGNSIRVLNIPGIDVEACGGTHLNNISEIEKIRIIKSERIQDGVNRVIFAASKMADEHLKEEQKNYEKIVEILKTSYHIENKENISEELQTVADIFSVQIDQIEKTIKRFLKETEIKEKTNVKNLKDASKDLFEKWKNTQKNKKKISTDQIDLLKQNSEKIPGTNINLITAKIDTDGTITAGKITKEKDYVVHIHDGKKLVSMASENINIDLREIAPEIGKILGGSGGGKPKMTQCGGPNKDKIDDALNLAKKLTIEKFK